MRIRFIIGCVCMVLACSVQAQTLSPECQEQLLQLAIQATAEKSLEDGLPSDAPNYYPGFCYDCPYEPEQQVDTSGGCYVYQSGDYTYYALMVCATSSNSCVADKQAGEQQCVRNAAKPISQGGCGSNSNSNSCFETRGDACHASFCQQVLACPGVASWPGCG